LVSEFIRDYLTLRNKKIPNKNKVYAEFKSIYANKKDEAYHQELENIKSLSIHYRKFINPSTVPDLSIRKELEYINRLEINVAYPFLLQVFEDADNGFLSKEDLLKVLKLVQSYAWRRFIVGLPTNALNKIFMTLYSEVDTEEYFESIAKALLKKKGSAKFPSNEDLKTSLKDKDLYNTQPKNRNYMFEMLENYNNREYVSTSNEHITIEHIFPKSPSDDWNSHISPEDFFQLKEKYLNTIANLTLSGNNGALSNKSFKEKKQMNVDGNETDRSGEGETLTETSGTIPTSADVPSGYSGKSRDFEQEDTEMLAHIDGGSTDINGADQALSICFWVKLTFFIFFR
jgi:hypothetical protein